MKSIAGAVRQRRIKIVFFAVQINQPTLLCIETTTKFPQLVDMPIIDKMGEVHYNYMALNERS